MDAQLMSDSSAGERVETMRESLRFLDDPIWFFFDKLRGVTVGGYGFGLLAALLFDLPGWLENLGRFVKGWRELVIPQLVLGVPVLKTLPSILIDYWTISFLVSLPFYWISARQALAALAPARRYSVGQSQFEFRAVPRIRMLSWSGQSLLYAAVSTLLLIPFGLALIYWHAALESDRERSIDTEGTVPPKPAWSPRGWRLARAFVNPIFYLGAFLVLYYSVEVFVTTLNSLF